MGSDRAFKWHIRIFTACGLLSSETSSAYYTYYSISISILSYILFPLSSIFCVFFLDSVDAIVGNLLITSTNVMLAIKGFNMLLKQKMFAELLKILKKLDESVSQAEYQRIFLPIFKRTNRLLLFFIIFYGFSWISEAHQVIVSPKAERMWSSTYYYPVEILHRPFIYFGGIIFQAVTAFHQVTVALTVDTFCAPLIDVANGHVKVLKERMGNLGFTLTEQKRKLKDFHQEKLTLVKLCETYILILRYEKISYLAIFNFNIYF